MKQVTTTTPMLLSLYKNDSIIHWMMMSHISNDKYIHQNEKAFKEEITEMFVFNVWTTALTCIFPPEMWLWDLYIFRILNIKHKAII